MLSQLPLLTDAVSAGFGQPPDHRTVLQADLA
jgi:hypothetical protein